MAKKPKKTSTPAAEEAPAVDEGFETLDVDPNEADPLGGEPALEAALEAEPEPPPSDVEPEPPQPEEPPPDVEPEVVAAEPEPERTLSEIPEEAEEPAPAEEPKEPKRGEEGCPFLREIASHPMGIDARVVAHAIGVPSAKAYEELNVLCDLGLARRVNELYQPTPLGAMRNAGQA